MLVYNITASELKDALKFTNKIFEDNIMFSKFEQKSKNCIDFRLQPRDYKKPGYKSNLQFDLNGIYKRRRAKACCWHVHGFLFDFILAINPDAYIRSSGIKIYKENGEIVNNWTNWIKSDWWNIHESDNCLCHEHLSDWIEIEKVYDSISKKCGYYVHTPDLYNVFTQHADLTV